MRLSRVRGLWLLAAFLAAGLVAELAAPREEPAPTIRPAAPRTEAVAADGAEPVGAWTANVLARPLFDASRRPGEGPAAVATGPAPQASLPRLAGVAILPTGRFAIFAGSGEREAATIASEGMAIGAWRVAAIAPGEVQVTGPEGRVTLRPRYSDAPVGAPVAAAPAPSIFAQPPGVPPYPTITGLPSLGPSLGPALPGLKAQR